MSTDWLHRCLGCPKEYTDEQMPGIYCNACMTRDERELREAQEKKYNTRRCACCGKQCWRLQDNESIFCKQCYEAFVHGTAKAKYKRVL